MMGEPTGGDRDGVPESCEGRGGARRPRSGRARGVAAGGAGPGEGVRFSYPPLLKHGWEITIVGLAALLGLWWLTVNITDSTWYDPWNLALLAIVLGLAVLGQVQQSLFAVRQPSWFVVREDVIEVRWRERVRRYRWEEVSVGEVEVVWVALCYGVRVTTPDGSFYVTTRLRHFDRFVACLREWSRGAAGGGSARAGSRTPSGTIRTG